MPVTLIVRSTDAEEKTKREALADRVIKYFGELLPPDYKLLCFLDDEDWVAFKQGYGAANRGLYAPLKLNTFRFDRTPWPDSLRDMIFVDDGVSMPFPRAFDHVIYLHESSCTGATGLTMTLAHELQHVIQHKNVRMLWVANSLIQNLPRMVTILKLPAFEIPIEREARIVAKRAAEDLCGEPAVRNYINRKIAEAVDAEEREDWLFVSKLTDSATVDLSRETQLLFDRFKNYKPQLKELLEQELKQNPDSDFKDLDLGRFFENTGA